MAQDLSLDDIDEQIMSKVYTQDYSPKDMIDGVKIIELKDYVGEDGDFVELMRLKDGALEAMPEFKVAQINRSKINPKTTKAWHLHFKQEEFWYVSPKEHLFLGLWDVRKDSPTNNKSMRIVLSGKSRLVYIPKGVAHGYSNFLNRAVDLFYFVNQNFNLEAPDEQRLPWDSLGANFWEPQKD